jgi:hypothetical protein
MIRSSEIGCGSLNEINGMPKNNTKCPTIESSRAARKIRNDLILGKR